MLEQKIEILFNNQIAHQTFLMGLRSEEIVKTAKPGQFVMIRIGSGMDPLLRRPFSISGTQGRDVFLLLYRVVGRGTKIISKWGQGESISILGPLGHGFELPKQDQIPLLVAGGIGTAPLFFLTQSLRDNAQLLMGFDSSNEVISPETLGYTNIRHTIATDDGSQGHAGLATDLFEIFLVQQSNKIDSLTLYTCGPIPMLKRVVDMALEYHIPCQVSLETVMACGLGACQGCAVHASSQNVPDYWHVCQDGPVFTYEEISELEEAL